MSANPCRSIVFFRSVSKKTALLQAEALACVSELANVLFCGSAVSFFFFLTAKLPQSFFRLVGNGYVYETFGISKLFLVKLQLLLIRAETLGNQLTAKCYIYDVVGMFIILILFFSFPKNIFRWH